MRKGQAALEFMMTYGWAIFAVLLGIAALTYFGVLTPKNFAAERCFVAAPFTCKEFAANSAGVTLVLTNGVERGLASAQITIENCATNTTGEVEADKEFRLTFPCTITKKVFDAKFNVSYVTGDGAINKTVEGVITAKVDQ